MPIFSFEISKKQQTKWQMIKPVKDSWGGVK